MNAIEWLTEIPRKNASRDFLINAISGERISFGDFNLSGCAIASDLLRRNLRKGDRIAIILHNSSGFAKIYLACLYAGIVTVPINPILSRGEIEHIISHSGAKLLILSDKTVHLVNPGEIEANAVEILTVCSEPGKAHPSGESKSAFWEIDGLEPDRAFVPLTGIEPDDWMTIVYTSGTTASPKGVIHTISDIVDNARLFNQRLGIGPENRFYGILSMAYLGGYYNLLMLPYVGESSVVATTAFDAKAAFEFWNVAKRYRVNTLWLVPTILAILMEMDRGRTGIDYCQENIKLAIVGTAPLPDNLGRRFEKKYGLTLFENYGLSETLFIATQSPKLTRASGSVGNLLPGVQISIRSDDETPVKHGQEGEITVATPHLMVGYHNHLSRDDSSQATADGWFPTGDIGLIKPTGELYITGRKKDLIIKGGLNVSPASIENVICQHKAVNECAIVGIPHSAYGEEIAAVLRLDQNVSIEQVRPEIIQMCKDYLSPAKQPTHYLETDSFPRSSTGKIQKDKVRALLVSKLNIPEVKQYAKPSDRPPNSKLPVMLPGRVKRFISRPPAELVNKFKTIPTSIISDCMNRMGNMDSSIQAVVKGRPFCGPAITVDEVEGGNLMSHIAIDLIQSGDVLVIDGKDSKSRAGWGGIQTELSFKKGACAIVLNGLIRDWEEIKASNSAVYAKGASPAGPLKSWGGNVNLPIACGGVVVKPGDIVKGDDDGVAVIPVEIAEELLQCCKNRQKMEEEWGSALDKETSTLDVLGLHETIAKLGIKFE